MSIKILMLTVTTFIIVFKNSHCEIEIPTEHERLIAGRSNPTYYGDCVRFQQSAITQIGNKYKFYYDIDLEAVEKHVDKKKGTYRYRVLDENCDETKETKFWEALKVITNKDSNDAQFIQTEEQKLQDWDDVWSGKANQTASEKFNRYVCNPKLMLQCIEGTCKCRKNDPYNYDTSFTNIFRGLVENLTTRLCVGTPFLKNVCSWNRPEVGVCNFNCVFGAECESVHESKFEIGLHAATCVCRSPDKKCQCAKDSELKCVVESSKNHGSINQPICGEFVKAAVIVILLVLLLSNDV